MKKTQLIRTLLYLLGDITAIMIATFLSVSFITNSSLYVVGHLIYYAGIPASFVLGLIAMSLYNVSWKHTGLRELVRIVAGLGLGMFLFAGLCLTLGYAHILQTAGPFLAFSTSILTVGGFRISRRVYSEIFLQPAYYNNAIVFGAGNAGEQIIRDIKRNPHWKLNILGLFDDDPGIEGISVHGVQVLGDRKRMYQFIKRNQLSELIIAAPSIPKSDIKEITNQVRSINPRISTRILPSFHRLSSESVGFDSVREIRLEDILGRETVKIDTNRISNSLQGKTIMVTGAGGSIGSEVVRQCAKFKPSRIIALDVDETELFHLENQLKNQEMIIPVVADVTDKFKMNLIMHKYAVDIIYHAAAYKHVPMMEKYPDEAVRVNVGGTKIVASLACKYKVEKMVMISTDKVVNPTSVMGATKRVAEQICMEYNTRNITQFVSVRFGNVLGSRGSVVPIFIDQIKKGGPITVTDPEMKRYFMTIPEAVLLVMQAGTMGDGGEVFVLDMGEPVKIVDMAKELIRLHGLEPDVDIKISFRGLRPGEKLFEELLTAEEGVESTTNEQIFVANCSRFKDTEGFNELINELELSMHMFDKDKIKRSLKKLVPTYKLDISVHTNGNTNGKEQEERELASV